MLPSRDVHSLGQSPLAQILHTENGMAYQLEREESIIDGLKRVASSELGSASDQLSKHTRTTRDEAIHEARKSIKKVRALLRLMRPELGETFAQENERLRNIARGLSALRDGFVMIQTLDSLRKDYSKEAGIRLRSIRAVLSKKWAESAHPENVGQVLDDAAAELKKAERRVQAWPLRAEGFAAISPGLEAIYRAGQKGLKRAVKTPTAENFHNLRKRVKDHWYHVRLLENLWTESIRDYEKTLKQLESALGEDHNLAVLRERIMTDPSYYGQQKDIDLLLGLIDRQQKSLRDEALALATQVYKEKPRELTRYLSRLWDTWRYEAHDLEGTLTFA
jgi:CHAD domain-containing protein